ncbi:MAG: [FeFe] hydrogenase H-cluster radical SAM maturase HydG, partial [Erysipelotrichaceae bacterium]
IASLLANAKKASHEQLEALLQKAERLEALDETDIAMLLELEDANQLQRLFALANRIKHRIYGNRIVMFAPLYVSDYCVNNCVYCGYRRDNKFPRRKLSREQIQKEVLHLEQMGHKRLALEVGEDPVHCDIDYILSAIDAIYETKNETGAIRRINVNVAATTVEDYKKLKERNIGTYILFQETYHQSTYERMHPQSLKSDYLYHLTAFDRAMEAGIDDVGAGVLFGLADPKFEVLGLLAHNHYLEQRFGVGFHTISVPRLKEAKGMSLAEYPHLVDDAMFKKIVAILRIAVPYTGLILSTRESAALRKELIHYGVSQVSAGSCTGVGGYEAAQTQESVAQFSVGDHRSVAEVLKELLEEGHIPSYCTACYRNGRTGDRFMALAKTGNIQNVCQPNALLTLQEYLLDYGDETLQALGEACIAKELETIAKPEIKALTIEKLEKIKLGKRDLNL